MANVKTAVSMDENLFQEMNRLAKRLGLNRSQLLSEAVRELVEEYRSKDLLEELDEAYGDQQAEEVELARSSKEYERRRVARAEE